MTCPEPQVVAFLAGELSPEEERLFDEHLLGCERCWRAVQADRTARLALERLREPAPAGLGSRVALAVGISSGEKLSPTLHSHRRPSLGRLHEALARPHRLVVAASLVVVAVAGGLSLALTAGRAPADPPQVAAVAAMFEPHSAPSKALRAGEHLMVDHQPMVVRAYLLSAGEAIVATSQVPFPVPPSSHELSGSSSKAWMATKGRLSMYGVNRPHGQQSMFLVAAMPMAELPGIAASLRLI